MRSQSNCIKAAKMRDNGVDLDIIADHFGWTVRTASVNVSRGRNWETFLKALRKNRKVCRDRARKAKRVKELPGLITRVIAEAKSLDLDVDHIVSEALKS